MRPRTRMIAEVVESGAEALVFSAIDFTRNAAAVDAAGQAGVKVVSIDSGVDSDQVGTYIGTDNYAAGRMAAQAALEGVEGELVVGLVNYDESTANGQERERGGPGRPGRERPGPGGRLGDHSGGGGAGPGGHRGPVAEQPGDQRGDRLQRAHQRGGRPGGGRVATGRRGLSGGLRLQCGHHRRPSGGLCGRPHRPEPLCHGLSGGGERLHAPGGGGGASWSRWWTPPPRSSTGATCSPWTARRPSLPSSDGRVGHCA